MQPQRGVWIWRPRNGAGEVFRRGAVVAEIEAGERAILVRCEVLWLQGDGPIVIRQRAREIAFHRCDIGFPGQGQGGNSRGVARVEPHRHVEIYCRRIGSALFCLTDAAAQIDIGAVGGESQRVVVVGDGLLTLASQSVNIAAIGIAVNDIGIFLDRGGEVGEGAIEIALSYPRPAAMNQGKRLHLRNIASENARAGLNPVPRRRGGAGTGTGVPILLILILRVTGGGRDSQNACCADRDSLEYLKAHREPGIKRTSGARRSLANAPVVAWLGAADESAAGAQRAAAAARTNNVSFGELHGAVGASRERRGTARSRR